MLSPSRGTSLGLLRDHGFRQLFTANAISQSGTQISQLALPLAAVATLGASNLAVGVLTTFQTLAFLLAGLPAGVWVDRLRRRSVLIVGDVGRALVLCSIPLAWFWHVLTVWQLYAVALSAGVLTVLFDVAYQSYLPHLVGRENIVEGNAKLETVRATAQVAGPAAAGWLVQWLAPPLSIGTDAISFLASAWFIGRIQKREPRPGREARGTLGREMVEGLRFVLGNPLLRAIAGCTSLFNLFDSVAIAMTMVFLYRTLGLPVGLIGLYTSITAVGGLIGAALTSRVTRWLGQGPTIWLAMAVTAPFGLLVPMAEPGWRVWLAASGQLVAGAGGVIYNVAQVSFRQRLTPEGLLGRMNATMRFLVWGTIPIGGFIGGVLGESLGARTTIWIGASGTCLAFLAIFASPLRWMRQLPEHC